MIDFKRIFQNLPCKEQLRLVWEAPRAYARGLRNRITTWWRNRK